MSKKKIWIVAFEFLPFPGGQATYAVEMARAFALMGHAVTVVAPYYRNAIGQKENFEIRRVFEHQKLDARALWNICRAMWSVGANDIVLAADIRAGLVTSFLWLFKKFTKITMFHGGEIKRAEYSRFAKISNQLSAAFSTKLVANSSYTAKLVKKHIGIQPHITLLGVSRYWLDDASGTFENEILRNLPADVPVICTVARLESRKGHLAAMKALRQMTDIDFRYIICGKAVYEDYAAEVLREVAVFPEKFVYVGQLSQNDVRLLYARSHIMLLAAQEEPGFVEGFGLVITEAGAQGCPSISTRVGGIIDAVIDGKTGILCDALNGDEIAQTIRELLQNKAKREQLGRAAHGYAASLTWEATAGKTLQQLAP